MFLFINLKNLKNLFKTLPFYKLLGKHQREAADAERMLCLFCFCYFASLKESFLFNVCFPFMSVDEYANVNVCVCICDCVILVQM